MNGIVLRKHYHNGESVSNSSTIPDPILTIGDVRGLCVRVELDESDIADVAVGQKAYITADAFGTRRFNSHVIFVGRQLGQKKIITGDPTQKIDTDVLEVLLKIDEDINFPIGLRVDAFIRTGK